MEQRDPIKFLPSRSLCRELWVIRRARTFPLVELSSSLVRGELNIILHIHEENREK